MKPREKCDRNFLGFSRFRTTNAAMDLIFFRCGNHPQDSVREQKKKTSGKFRPRSPTSCGRSPPFKKKSSGELEKSSLKFEIPPGELGSMPSHLSTRHTPRASSPKAAPGRRKVQSSGELRQRETWPSRLSGSLGCTKWGPIVKLVYTWFNYNLWQVAELVYFTRSTRSTIWCMASS